MEINIRKRDGVTIFDIDGRIIGSDALRLKHLIDEQIVESETGCVKIILNLGKVRIIDGSGLGAIVSTYMNTQKKGGRISLLNVTGDLNSLLVIAKLLTIFDRYNDEDEAIASFN